MPDNPDYSKYLTGSIRFSLQDMGELAARLGSMSVMDRRGEIIFMDDCSKGLSKWTALGGGTGFSVTTVTDRSYFSGFSYKLVGGSTTSFLARLEKYFDLMDASKVGFEVLFSDQEEIDYFSLLADFSDGVNIYTGSIKISFSTNKLQYLNSSGTYTDLDTYYQVTGDAGNFVHLKFVMDTSTKKYNRVMQGVHHYDMSGISIRTGAPSTRKYYRISIDLVSNSGANGIGYVGGFILTANEP